MCRLAQGDQRVIKCEGIEKHHGQCPEGKIPFLRPANRDIWNVFQMIMPGLGNGMGGMDYTAIQVTFDNCNIEQKVRPYWFPRIVKLIDVARTEQKKSNAT